MLYVELYFSITKDNNEVIPDTDPASGAGAQEVPYPSHYVL